MKKLIFLTILFFIMAQPAIAQTQKSNEVRTKVGSASTTIPDSTDSALSWNVKINNALEKGAVWGYFNRMVTSISNGKISTKNRQGSEINTSDRGLYWCTNSIIDSYTLSGRQGLNDNHQGVVSMVSFWQSTQGYKYVDYFTVNHQEIYSRIAPGYAIFFVRFPGRHTGSEHVAMVKTVNLDQRGNGFIETYDSNSSQKVNKYPIVGWHILNTPYQVMGFGGV